MRTIALVISIVVSIVFLVGLSSAELLRLTPSDDSWVYSYDSDRNYGSDTSLGSAIQFMSPRGYTLLKFSLPDLTDHVVEMATLYLYQFNGGGYGEGPTALLRSSNDTWDEHTLTWNNASAGVLSLLATNKDGHSHRGWSAWNFQWSSGFGNTITFWLGENSSGDQSHNWYSKEDSVTGRRPYLLVVTNPTSFVDFSDVPPGYWAWLYIRVIFGAGYTTGYGGTNAFRPDYDVTREQMAGFIIRAKDGEPADGYCSNGVPFFADVDPSSWSCKYIKRLYELGLTTGYGGTNEFKPGLTVTREQMATVAIRALEGEPDPNSCSSGSPFTDVDPSSWSCKYIKRLYELGLTTGYGGTNEFKPGLTVTRAQMAALMARAFLGMK